MNKMELVRAIKSASKIYINPAGDGPYVRVSKQEMLQSVKYVQPNLEKPAAFGFLDDMLILTIDRMFGEDGE